MSHQKAWSRWIIHLVLFLIFRGGYYDCFRSCTQLESYFRFCLREFSDNLQNRRSRLTGFLFDFSGFDHGAIFC